MSGGIAQDLIGKAERREALFGIVGLGYVGLPLAVELANAVYSGVPSQLFGLEQIIDVGPMSGKSNILFWLERHGMQANEELVERIYHRAKSSDHTLTDDEILQCVEEH